MAKIVEIDSRDIDIDVDIDRYEEVELDFSNAVNPAPPIDEEGDDDHKKAIWNSIVISVGSVFLLLMLIMGIKIHDNNNPKYIKLHMNISDSDMTPSYGFKYDESLEQAIANGLDPTGVEMIREGSNIYFNADGYYLVGIEQRLETNEPTHKYSDEYFRQLQLNGQNIENTYIIGFSVDRTFEGAN